jgi:hypothetical protein
MSDVGLDLTTRQPRRTPRREVEMLAIRVKALACGAKDRKSRLCRRPQIFTIFKSDREAK